MRCFSLALVLTVLLPHGPSWAGFCAMAETTSEETHACARGAKACPHHSHEPEPASADCHSKEPRTKPELTLGCGCGSGHESAPIAASVFDRLGPVQSPVQFPPSIESRALAPGGPAHPSDPLIDRLTPPPRSAT